MIIHCVLELVDRIIVVDGDRIVIDGPKEAVLKTLQTGAKPAPVKAVEA